MGAIFSGLVALMSGLSAGSSAMKSVVLSDCWQLATDQVTRTHAPFVASGSVAFTSSVAHGAAAGRGLAWHSFLL